MWLNPLLFTPHIILNIQTLLVLCYMYNLKEHPYFLVLVSLCFNFWIDSLYWPPLSYFIVAKPGLLTGPRRHVFLLLILSLRDLAYAMFFLLPFLITHCVLCLVAEFFFGGFRCICVFSWDMYILCLFFKVFICTLIFGVFSIFLFLFIFQK